MVIAAEPVNADNSLSLVIVDGISESTISPRIVADDLSSTFVNPTIALVTPLTVPVNVGLANIVALDSLVTWSNPT